MQPFEPHPLLRGPHLQTIFGAFGRRPPRLVTRGERFELPDGDFVDLEHAGPEQGRRAVLLHGLTGSARSTYIRALAAELVDAGWAVTAFQFRSASGPNRTARCYHSGDTEDIAQVAAALRRRDPGARLCAVGFSLGGNVLLKLFGEEGAHAVFDGGVAVSVPYRLAVCADRLASGGSRIYCRYLLLHLKRTLRAKRALVLPHIDLAKVLAATDFRGFDEHATAPLHGFAGADDYYERASSAGFIARIQRPTLLLHALDDPFMLPDTVPEPATLPACVTLEAHATGGHVGFFERGPKGLPRSFLERRIRAWLDDFDRDQRIVRMPSAADSASGDGRASRIC